MKWRKAEMLMLVAAMGGIPLITTATCNPASGTFDFYRNDDGYGGILDVFIDDGWYYDDWYYDDCYYDDCYYDSYYDDCWLCF